MLPLFDQHMGMTSWVLLLFVYCRYQLLAGVIEERGIETLFKGNYQLCAALSFIVRTGNTFLGSLLWVDFVRLLGEFRGK
jgi:hypothetical protein